MPWSGAEQRAWSAASGLCCLETRAPQASTLSMGSLAEPAILLSCYCSPMLWLGELYPRHGRGQEPSKSEKLLARGVAFPAAAAPLPQKPSQLQCLKATALGTTTDLALLKGSRGHLLLTLLPAKPGQQQPKLQSPRAWQSAPMPHKRESPTQDCHPEAFLPMLPFQVLQGKDAVVEWHTAPMLWQGHI